MKRFGVASVVTVMIGIMFAFTSCEQSTSTELEESFAEIKQVTAIESAQNTTMELQTGESQDSYFTVTLGDGSTREGWCVEWDEPSIKGLQEGVDLYSTQGKEEWKELNYFMSIKDDLRAEDPDLTYKEIQVAIWSLIDNPSFDVDKIAEYDNVDPRIFKDGEALFDVQKVKDILGRVEERFQSTQQKTSLWDYFVIFIKNKGQTVMVSAESAFAFGGDYATCFTDFSELRSKRWGWSNGPLGEGEYEFDIYAGAGRCDLGKGTLVGKLLVNYSSGTAEVTFKMTENSEFTEELYTMITTHLYVGNDALPNIGGWMYTVAPGLYGNVDYHDNVNEYTYTIEGLSGDIYVIGHADVNGF